MGQWQLSATIVTTVVDTIMNPAENKYETIDWAALKVPEDELCKYWQKKKWKTELRQNVYNT